VAFVAGLGVVRPAVATEHSLEEIIFQATAAALADAGLSRDDIDGVSIAASDQLDGRAISSMHLAGPAGSYLLDEVKVTDDGAAALALSVLRIESGMSRRVLAVTWTKPSASDYSAAVAVNPEPTYVRAVGLHPTVTEAIATAAFLRETGTPPDAFDPFAAKIWPGPGDGADLVSWPLRRMHIPPLTEGAIALVLTADPTPVEIAGMAWGADHPDPTRRGGALGSLPEIARSAYREAGLTPAADLTVETTDRTVFRLAMAAAGLGLVAPAEAAAAVTSGGLANLNRSGGLWRSNPVFAAGLERVAEATSWVRDHDEVAVAHSTYGSGGQGNLVAVLRRAA